MLRRTFSCDRSPADRPGCAMAATLRRAGSRVRTIATGSGDSLSAGRPDTIPGRSVSAGPGRREKEKVRSLRPGRTHIPALGGSRHRSRPDAPTRARTAVGCLIWIFYAFYDARSGAIQRRLVMRGVLCAPGGRRPRGGLYPTAYSNRDGLHKTESTHLRMFGVMYSGTEICINSL